MNQSNRARAERVAQIRRSGAAGLHDARPNRQRTRATARRAAISDGW